MARKIIISAFGGLALSFCVATSSFAAQALSDNQMDNVTAGQGATATLDIGTRTALGPTTATDTLDIGTRTALGPTTATVTLDIGTLTAGGPTTATVTLDIGTLTAIGPTTATATANNIAVIATQVGGLAPSSSASVTATLTATAM